MSEPKKYDTDVLRQDIEYVRHLLSEMWALHWIYTHDDVQHLEGRYEEAVTRFLPEVDERLDKYR
jgi:hypothetical protein